MLSLAMTPSPEISGSSASTDMIFVFPVSVSLSKHAAFDLRFHAQQDADFLGSSNTQPTSNIC